MTVTEQLSALDQILAHGDLHSLFQPIIAQADQRTLGYEALTRGHRTARCIWPSPCSA